MERLEELCGSFHAELRRKLTVAGVSRMAILGLSLLTLFVLLDWRLHFAPVWRSINLALFAGALGSAFWWTLWAPLTDRWDRKQTLSYLDTLLSRDHAMLRDLSELLDGQAIEEMGTPVGRALVEESIRKLLPVVEQAMQSERLRRSRVKQWLRWAGVACLLVMAIAALSPRHALTGCTRFFNPFSTARWPHRTTIALDVPDTGWSVPRMESLTVKGRVIGVQPPRVRIFYRDRAARFWTRERLRIQDDGALVYTFPQVREPLRFYIEGGDYATETYRVDVVQRPYLKHIVARYEYPIYAGIPNRQVESGQLNGIEGTKVHLTFLASMKLGKAVFAQDGKEPEALSTKDGLRFEKTLTLERDGRYAVELYDEHGFREARPEVYDIRVIPDHPPEIEMLAPGRDLLATRRASVTVAFRVKDDFGLERVRVLSQIEGSNAVEIADHVTGPIPQRGRLSEWRFTWNLRKSDLPDVGSVRYFVRAQDVNPTGRGVSESQQFEIKLVKPSEFHLDAIEKAKHIEAEARIAWENQLQAWKLAARWAAEGTGREDDPLWLDMQEKQALAIRAAKSMDAQLEDLTAKHEENDMAREFMSVRLNDMAAGLRNVTAEYHPAIDADIRGARPTTAHEALGDALRARRGKAYNQFKDKQKLATLSLERALKKLFDWRDLQIGAVRATLLHEEQSEVADLTEKIAPNFLGYEKEDLADEDLDRLLTLGKRQRTLFDVATELESQLVLMKSNAKAQQRDAIQKPLDTAYEVLRANRVNDRLKEAARLIANNQPYQILQQQRDALNALNIVKGGLLLAGQKADEHPPITLAMTPMDTLREVVDQDDRAQPPVESAVADDAPARRLDIATLLAALPTGDDRLSMALGIAWEQQESVRARTRYLAQNSATNELPRFITLKQLILGDFQDDALRALALAGKEAAAAPETQSLTDRIDQAMDEFRQSRLLISRRAVGAGTEQLQSDAMDTIKEMIGYISLNKAVNEAVDENIKRGGKDAFDREYVVRNKDLDAMLEIVRDINHATLLKNDALRKMRRFHKLPATDPLLVEIEKRNRAAAETLLGRATAMLRGIAPKSERLSPEVKEMARAAGVAMPADIESLSLAALELNADATLAAGDKAVSFLAQAIQGIRSLLSERVKTREELAAAEPPRFEAVDQEEWDRRRGAQYLQERLKSDTGLPPDVREIMLRALGREFPPAYKNLISAYYASFLKEQKEQKK